jgi:hypothetical protein
MTPADKSSAPEPNPLGQYVPLFSWAIVVVLLLLIPLKIIGYGFLPGGDARRHVAKAFTDKPYTDLLVLRPEYKMDHSPGWERLLRFLHERAGLNEDQLMSFSVIGLMLCVFYAPLPWLRRPEAWIAALLAQMVAIPEVMIRLTQARPMLLTEGVLIAILFSWSKPVTQTPSKLKLALTCIGFALSAWMHGAWYLWVLPLAAFFLARWWRAGLWLTACWAAGTFAGALLTGRPFAFLKQAIDIASVISHEHVPQWLLVGEFLPSYGEFATVALVGLVLLWRAVAVKGGSNPFSQPVFWLLVICWICGFKADRWWADWGVPAVLVWLTFQFEELMTTSLGAESLNRLLACGLLAVPLFLQSTNDLERRYSRSSKEYFLDAQDPALQGWLPEPGGIFYSAQMGFFYNTFYKNPQANWRYILGLEPALMPEDDLKTYRSIQLSGGAVRAYEPWRDKLRPADRLMIISAAQPDLSGLEWHDGGGNMWIGRLPKTAR